MPRRAACCLAVVALIASVVLAPNTSGQVGGAQPQNVIWTNVTNCTLTGNSLRKSAGRSDSADAGARSEQSVTSGDAYFEFTAGESSDVLFCGFSHTASGTGYSEIDFAVKLTEIGVAEVRENNVYLAETTYRAGDVFRVAVQAGSVRYYKNGGLFYSSAKPPAYPLFADASFLTLGGRVDNAMIGALAVSVATADWKMYQHDETHSGVSTASDIAIPNVASLTPAWAFQTGDWVTCTPIVSGGVVYAGSWDGRMYALRESDGSQIWSYDAGRQPQLERCQTTYGIDSTAALAGGKLYFGNGLAQLYALNASNGQLIWKTQLADPNQAFHIWNSPVVSNGKIYVGLASHCVNPCVQGRLVCVDANDGRVLWSFAAAPDGSTGGAVWSSAAVDATRRIAYVGTGNFCTGVDSHSSEVVALNADTGSLIWTFRKVPFGDKNNLDFGSSPVLYDIGSTPVLAIPSKDGHCYALNRVTGELLWDTLVTDGNSIGGSISSPAVAYGRIYFGGTVQLRTGKVVALDQRDGRIVWDVPQSSKVFGAAAVSGGVLLIGGFDGRIHAYDASTGAELWNAQTNAIAGGVSISERRVFVGSMDHNVYAFSLPNIGPPPQAATIRVNSPSGGDVWSKRQRYDITWTASAAITRVDVSISRDGGVTWDLLADDTDAAAGVVNVKARKPRSETVIVRVSDASNPAVFSESGMFYIR
ncbi:MAG TPA: PQQ-binding-like beta-propeller repeat protein [Blastocatellia bacterium]|nr:PQQ-binding-like beta-propeller repeat protein [Blastocatellia bacterium]